MGNAATSARFAAQAASTPASSTWAAFADRWTRLDEVQEALRRAGLESCNLIVGVDFTASNVWTGKRTFGGQPLHTLGAASPNPYEQALAVVGATLAPFDDDGLIPAYGFGCSRTHDNGVFSFSAGEAPCAGLHEVLRRYRDIAPSVKLAGPTSFAPIIRRAMEITARERAFHILLIVADGQVTRPSDMPEGAFSSQEQDTIAAIVDASALPLAIVLVGVGDGPWE